MSIGFPVNTVILILATMIASGIAVRFMFARGLKSLRISPHTKQFWGWVAAILLAGWFGTRLALAISPPGENVLATQFLITFILLGLILVVGIAPLLLSSRFRQLVRAIPETWIVGANAIRLEGFLFLALMDMNLLPSEFALSAGNGDMTVGLFALGIVYLLARRKPYARTLLIAWNLLGLLDFVSALITGGIFIVPFAQQLAAAGTSLLYLNFVLIVPSFGVPLYALLHLYSLYKALSGRVHETGQGIKIPPKTSDLFDKQPAIQVYSSSDRF